MIFLKCKICFIYVGFNCKRKKGGVKKCLEICAIKGGGGRRLMANNILNFHFDYWNTSLSSARSALKLVLHLWLVVLTSVKWVGGKHLLLARWLSCIWTFVKFFKRKKLLAEPTIGSLEWILHEREDLFSRIFLADVWLCNFPTEHKILSQGGTGTWRINAMDTTGAIEHLLAKIITLLKRE